MLPAGKIAPENKDSGISTGGGPCSGISRTIPANIIYMLFWEKINSRKWIFRIYYEKALKRRAIAEKEACLSRFDHEIFAKAFPAGDAGLPDHFLVILLTSHLPFCFFISISAKDSLLKSW